MALPLSALGIVLSVGSLVFVFLAFADSSSNPYPAAGRGHDISYPQCNSTLPDIQSFAVIGVNRGRPFTENPCLFSEYAWATLATMPPSLYMNISGALGSTADRGNTGPAGTCAADDTSCLAYNYGFNAAQDAYAYADSVGVTSQYWWLDVETANTWHSDTAYNQRAVQGAAAFLALSGVSVGVYSTNYQWHLLMGDYTPDLPVWYATAAGYAGAPNYCSDSYNFAGGGVWLVQYYGGDFDANYACGPASPDPTQTPAATLTPHSTETSSPTLPSTSVIDATATATDTPTVTPTATDTSTATPTDTSTPTSTSTPTDTETPTSTAAPALTADVNCDGLVDSIDVELVLQHDAGLLPSLACQQAGDTNSDGAINAVDAALILQYVAGLISHL
jgi:hypothetical protein